MNKKDGSEKQNDSTQKKKKYSSAQDYQVLGGTTKAVRETVGMYIGSTGERGWHHLAEEAIANAVDEGNAKDEETGEYYCQNIWVTLSADQTTFTIKDDGQAITHEVQEDTGKSTLLAIFTVIHSGGKFSDKVSKGKVYKTAGGLHGVGATVINALSKSLRVESSRQGKTEILTFVQGELTSAQIIDTPERIDGLTLEFTPDPEIFEEFTYFKTEIIQGRLRELAYLNPHLIFHFSCPPEAEPTVYHFAGGLASLIEEINQDQETLSEICYEEWEDEKENFQLNFAWQYTSNYERNIHSFCNNIRTRSGGTHVEGFEAGLLKACQELISKKNPNLEIVPNDVREGLVAVISVRIKRPEFAGQTKDVLVNKKVREITRKATQELVNRFFQDNSATAEKIARKIIDNATIRARIKEEQDLLRGNKEELILPGVLSASEANEEIFFVEGKSAGGSAEEGRDPKTQTVFALQGKLPNALKGLFSRVLKNKIISNALLALGFADHKGLLKNDYVRFRPLLEQQTIEEELSLLEDFTYQEADEQKIIPANIPLNLEQLAIVVRETLKNLLGKANFKKIILMADPDDDGAHIVVLLLTFIFKYLPYLIEGGKVFVAVPPLYRVQSKKEIHYFYNKKELDDYQQGRPGMEKKIERIKGLGQMDASELFESTMDPDRRHLYSINITDWSKTKRIIQELMGINADKRKEFLEERSYHELALTISEEQKVDLANLALVYFTIYAIAVSEKGRALPDINDGFKSSQRRILFALYQLGITPNKDVVTSANIVGKTMADWHPHGDQGIYYAMANMVRADKFRYPLVYGRGNFGYDKNPPAAYKYTKVKLTPYGLSMLEDIAYGVVDLKNNYDDSKGKEEPVVLPVIVPNLLLNGSIGIGVGMTTSIPPHHLGETLTATINLINNPDLIPIKKLQEELYTNVKNRIETLRTSASVITHEELIDKINDLHGAGTITKFDEAGWHEYIDDAGYSTEELAKREKRLIEALEEIRNANLAAKITDESKDQPITATDSAPQRLIEEQLSTLTEERKRIEENFLQLKKKVNQELVNDLQGPDFPTGGYILEKEKLPSIYEKGEGTIYLRAKVKIVSPREIITGKEIEGAEKSVRSVIWITELPYNVSKSTLTAKIAKIIRDKEISGLKWVADYSNRGITDIRIEFDAKQYEGQAILNKLYKSTPLQISFSVKMRATLGNRPKMFSLTEILQQFISKRLECILRKSQFLWRENEKKLFDLETRRFIIEHDQEISEIVQNKDISDEECNQELKNRFGMEIKSLQERLQSTQDNLLPYSPKEPSDLEQKVVDRILDTRRSSFRQLRPGKQTDLTNEIEELKTKNEELIRLVISEEKRKEKLIADLEQLKKDYEKDTRRTKIISDSHLIDERKAIAPEEIIIILSKGEKRKKTKAETEEKEGKMASYLNIYKVGSLDATNIPSVGKELKTRGENLTIIKSNRRDDLWCFSNFGKLYIVPVYKADKSTNLRETGLAKLAEGEIIEQVISVREDFFLEENRPEKHLVILTKKGKIKRLPLEKVGRVLASGKRVVNVIKKKDQISQISFLSGSDEIMVFTKKGRVKTFAEEKVRIFGRSAYGDTSIKLSGSHSKVRCSRHQSLIERHRTATCCDKSQGISALSRCRMFKNLSREIRNCLDCNKVVPLAPQAQDEVVGLVTIRPEQKKEELSLLVTKEDNSGIKVPLLSVFKLAKRRGGAGRQSFKTEERRISPYCTKHESSISKIKGSYENANEKVKEAQKKIEQLKKILNQAQTEQVNPEVIKKYEQELTLVKEEQKKQKGGVEKKRQELEKAKKKFQECADCRKNCPHHETLKVEHENATCCDKKKVEIIALKEKIIQGRAKGIRPETIKKYERARQELQKLSLKNRVKCLQFQANNQEIRHCADCQKQRGKKAVKITPTLVKKALLVNTSSLVKETKPEIYLLAGEAVCWYSKKDLVDFFQSEKKKKIQLYKAPKTITNLNIYYQVEAPASG